MFFSKTVKSHFPMKFENHIFCQICKITILINTSKSCFLPKLQNIFSTKTRKSCFHQECKITFSRRNHKIMPKLQNMFLQNIFLQKSYTYFSVKCLFCQIWKIMFCVKTAKLYFDREIIYFFKITNFLLTISFSIFEMLTSHLVMILFGLEM